MHEIQPEIPGSAFDIRMAQLTLQQYSANEPWPKKPRIAGGRNGGFWLGQPGKNMVLAGKQEETHGKTVHSGGGNRGKHLGKALDILGGKHLGFFRR